MKIRSFLLSATLASGFVSFAHAGPITSVSPPAGQFGLPYNPNQVWSACGSTGWAPYGDPNSHQYHMQWNDSIGKYHMGEDWNGICGGSTDSGAPLLAIGDGKVVYVDSVDNSAKGKQLHIRYSFPYALGAGGVQTFDSIFLHINNIAPGIVWTQGVPGSGSSVTKGQAVAYLGGTGNWIPHLHWETQWDDDSDLLTANSYQNPLAVTHALKYRAPSLIVDDRSDAITFGGTAGQWMVFQMTGIAPSSIAYVEYGGERKSLQNAINAGWMATYGIPAWNGSVWTWPSINTVFFSNAQWYAWMPMINGATLFILRPKNNFQQDRARLDMIHAVENDPRFVSIKMDANDPYGYDPNWDPSWELHYMGFTLSDGRTAYANQATLKSNRLHRYTSYYDIDLGQWTTWQQVDLNKLY